MSKKTIYIVYENIADYESAPDPIGFVFTPEEAKNIVDEKTKVYVEVNEWANKLWDKRREFNALPTNDVFEKLLDNKKWPAGIGEKDITQEMRNERTKINLLNKAIEERNRVKRVEIIAKEKEYVKELFMSMPDNIRSYFDAYMNLSLNTLRMDQPYFFESLNEI